jgi:hypothetical protein
MKTTILSLVATFLLGAASSYAQFTSNPAEPGLRDHLKGHTASVVKVLDEKTMVINGISADWVSHDQITLSAVVIELKNLTAATRERIARHLTEYNVSSPVGTLSLDNGTVRMTHYLNPRHVSPAEITRTVALLKAAVESERKELDRSMASR